MSIDAKPMPAVERLREQFSYDPDSGEIRWKVKRSGVKVGVAGSVTDSGYLKVMIDRQPVFAHRLAWKLFYGSEPPRILDHINGDRKDNRIANIRGVTSSENAWNKTVIPRTKTGLKGVTFCKQTQKYRAMLCTAGKTICLGRYDDPAKARDAYLAAAHKAFGKFIRAEVL